MPWLFLRSCSSLSLLHRYMWIEWSFSVLNCTLIKLRIDTVSFSRRYKVDYQDSWKFGKILEFNIRIQNFSKFNATWQQLRFHRYMTELNSKHLNIYRIVDRIADTYMLIEERQVQAKGPKPASAAFVTFQWAYSVFSSAVTTSTRYLQLKVPQ